LNISTPCHNRLARLAEADDFHFLANFHFAALDSSRHHRAAALNRKNIFNRHQKRLVQFARRLRNVFVHRRHQLVDLLFALLFAIQRAQCRYPHHRNIVARKLVALQQLAHFQFDQFEQLRIVHRINLVQRHDQIGHAHLPRQQHVFARLRHRTVGRGYHQNAAIHLRRARDHVLDVVGVTRAVDVRVVPVRRFILDVRRRDGDSASLFFGRVVDRIKRPERVLRIVLRQNFRDSRRQRGLAMIDVTNRPNVAVRLVAIKFLFRHNSALCS